MAEAVETGRVSLDEYLTTEPGSEFKREYVNGEILAMAGASYAHNRIASNLLRHLGNALAETSFAVFGSDLRVLVEETGLFAYPDGSVVCGPPRLLPDIRQDTLLNPVALFEILSNSTEGWDRGAKASHYRKMASLAEYVLLSQNEARVEHYVKGRDGRWILQTEVLGWCEDDLELISAPARISVRQLYQGVPGVDPAAQRPLS